MNAKDEDDLSRFALAVRSCGKRRAWEQRGNNNSNRAREFINGKEKELPGGGGFAEGGMRSSSSISKLNFFSFFLPPFSCCFAAPSQSRRPNIVSRAPLEKGQPTEHTTEREEEAEQK